MPEPMTLKLGKLPALEDYRTIKFANILRPALLPPIPDEFDLDKDLDVTDDRMYLNDQLGDCVIAARAHMTLRFEKFEQNKLIDITDEEVRDEYFEESGGVDSGLYLLDSLNHWRKDGWTAAGQHHHIHAFASVDWKDHQQVKQAIYLMGGVYFGMSVYQEDIDQFNAGEGWHLTSSSGRFLGGHAVYTFRYIEIVGYDKNGLIVMTWGKKQHMAWAFWDARVDEAYIIIDNKDDWMDNSPVDIPKLEGYLKEITGHEPNPEPEPNPGSGCCLWRLLKRIFNR